MLITCKHCGATKVVEQPTIVLSLGHWEEKGNTPAVISCATTPLESADLHMLGRNFRKWWDGHVAGGFNRGFFNTDK